MDYWWPCLGTLRFGSHEEYRRYEEEKHNFGQRLTKDDYLEKGQQLGETFISRILEIMANHNYIFGGQYNCQSFKDCIQAGLGVKVEIKYMTLVHKANRLGLKKIGVLFSDSDWKPVSIKVQEKKKDQIIISL